MGGKLFERTVDRRTVVVGGVKLAAATALAARFADPVLADEASELSGEELGYPELTVTITDSGYDLSATSVPAGYLLLTVRNSTRQPLGAAVLGPGPGQTMADLQAEAATPTAGDAFPAFFYDITIPGGPGSAAPSGMAQAVIQLAAGDWAVWGDGDQPPTFFTATEGTPAPQPEPAADLALTEIDFAFEGLAGPIVAGPRTWKVTNSGTQPHMLVLGKVPDTTTMDQIMEVMGRPDNATPPPGGLGEEDFQDAGGVLLQSSGTTVWTRLDLQAGRHVAVCFVTDPATGKPHAMEGMVAMFDVGVGEPATPAA